MKIKESLWVIAQFIMIITVVLLFSLLSGKIWGGKSEEAVDDKTFSIEKEMTIEQFGKANKIPNPQLKEIFKLENKSDLQKNILAEGSQKEITDIVNKNLALAAEHASKNWKKIVVKFALWIIYLIDIFFLLLFKKIGNTIRKIILLTSVTIFGIIMGSDPSPMGTVKDAIFLFATKHVIFPPRLIALTVFIILVILANKLICGWGCQLGTLQDLIFRINRNRKHKGIIGKQIKIPFIISNSIRIFFFAIFTTIAIFWALDIIGLIDPFKIFAPIHLSIAGAIFVSLILIASLFTYRPWCNLFCPFGLVSWFFEKLSIFKIKVDYDKCISCQKCVTACPSTAMSAILKRDKKVIPDCFSCNSCKSACPTGAISYSA